MVQYTKNEHKILTAGGGTDIVIREFVYKADKSGKVFYIQSGLHGGETSQWNLYKLHNFLMDNLQAGEVHIVPYANPLAWMQRSYFSTFGKFSLLDGKDFNRGFPGNNNGDQNARICAAIMGLAKKADFVVDLHTSKHSKPFIIYTKKEYNPWVKACGISMAQFSDDAHISGLETTFNAALDVLGIENICLECGGHNELVEDNNEIVFDALCRLLAKAEMCRHFSDKEDEVFVFEKRKKIYASCGGLLQPLKKLGDKIEAEELIAYILPANDLATKVEVRASCKGVIQIMIPGYIVWEGDVVVEIVPEDDLHKL